MRVFVTGATGFIGMPTVRELISAGHQVVGLCRSEEKAPALAATGAEVLRGSMLDLELLKTAAASSDGVIHLAFNHDFSRFLENCDDDRRVIEALGAGLAGTKKPLVITSGTAIANSAPGVPALEDNPPSSANPRAASEAAADALAALGLNVSVVRLPQVHDPERQGLISFAIEVFLEKGVCAYVGDGLNRWPAAPVLDVARLYRLALERAAPNAKYHAVAEEGVTMREVVETIAPRLGLPVKSVSAEDAPSMFGWLSMFAGLDMPASSAETRKALGWDPTGPALLEDLRRLVVPAR